MQLPRTVTKVSFVLLWKFTLLDPIRQGESGSGVIIPRREESGRNFKVRCINKRQQYNPPRTHRKCRRNACSKRGANRNRGDRGHHRSEVEILLHLLNGRSSGSHRNPHGREGIVRARTRTVSEPGRSHFVYFEVLPGCGEWVSERGLSNDVRGMAGANGIRIDPRRRLRNLSERYNGCTSTDVR